MTYINNINCLVVILAFCLISFVLGKFSVLRLTKSDDPIIFTIKKEYLRGGGVVSSVNSNYYHLPYCPGASRIKESNKVFYSDIDSAKSAGLVPAKNCKGI